MRTMTTVLFLAAMAIPVAARAQVYDSGSDGSDGAWVVEPLVDGDGNHLVRYLDLPDSGVFHFTSVHVKPGAWVRFRRNADNTPVTILSQGDVVIEGLVDASAMQWADYYRPTFPGPGGFTYARDMTAYEKGWCRNLVGAPWVDLYGVGCAGGPGGFDGASSRYSPLADPNSDPTLGSAAFGPSGAPRWADASCYPGPGLVPQGGASAAYPGPCTCFESTPVGGSVPAPGGLALPVGGPGWYLTAGGSGASDASGNGGGGAITLASSTRVEVAETGAVLAYEGNGDSGGVSGGIGGGGTIRIAAPAVRVKGDVRANQFSQVMDPTGQVCSGRLARGIVRIESWSPDVDIYFDGIDPTGVFPGPQFDVPRRALPWPEAQRPRLWIDSVAGKTVVPPPRDLPPVAAPALLLPPDQPLDVIVKAQNVPTGTVVKVAMNLVGGSRTVKDSPPLAGTAAASQATVSFTIPGAAVLGGFEAWVERIQVAQ